MKESEIQKQIMNYLLQSPVVAWAYVTSAGTVRGVGGGRYFNIGFPGLSDILGQLRDGRIFAIEVKRPGNIPTQEQREFLELVNENNGLGIWVDTVKGVIRELEKITKNS